MILMGDSVGLFILANSISVGLALGNEMLGVELLVHSTHA